MGKRRTEIIPYTIDLLSMNEVAQSMDVPRTKAIEIVGDAAANREIEIYRNGRMEVYVSIADFNRLERPRPV